MEKVFFSGDPHYSHTNVLKYSDRNFSNVHEMNKELTQAWNKIVGPKDNVWMLGDLTMDKRKVPEILDRLNGRIHYVYGNHDKKSRGIIAAHPKVVWTGDLAFPTFNKTPFTLSHYAMRVWSASHYGAISLFSHSHGTLPPVERSMDVGVDVAFRLLGEYRPFSLEEVFYFTSKEGQPKVKEVIYDYIKFIHETMGNQLEQEELEHKETTYRLVSADDKEIAVAEEISLILHSGDSDED